MCGFHRNKANADDEDPKELNVQLELTLARFREMKTDRSPSGEIKAKKDMDISKHGARSDIPALMGIKI